MLRQLALLLFSSGLACADPIADYRFQTSLADSLATSQDLSPAILGDGGFIIETVGDASRTVRTFTAGGGFGVGVDGLLGSSNYTVAILMRFDQTSSYARILDTLTGQSDLGLYARGNDLVLYTPALDTETDAFQPNTWLQVVFTRDADGIAAGYIDGYPQFRVADTVDAALISEAATLRFFVDDGGENSGGAVARIRLWDTALSARAIAVLDDNLGDRIFIDGMETL
jgi:hypothetical protein